MHDDCCPAALLQVVGGAILLAGAQGEQHINQSALCWVVPMQKHQCLMPYSHTEDAGGLPTGASVGLQAYDAVAGTQGLTLSRYVTPAESQRQFPTLSSAHDGGNSLKGTVRARRRVARFHCSMSTDTCRKSCHMYFCVMPSADCIS